MGIHNSNNHPTTNNNIMKAFVAVSALLAAAVADETHRQVIKHGNAPAVSHSVHKPHGSYAAIVSQQPHAAPQDVHNPHAVEKASTVVHHPVIHHPVVHRPIQVAYSHPVVVPKKVAHPVRVYHPPPVVVHKPVAVYKEPVHADVPAVYQYDYAVADDYSGANFASNEKRDGYATSGEYRVAR